MKKISIIVMALVFLVALTQCKKEQATPANDGKTVDITLDIKSGKGTRMDVNTVTGEVTYVSGDKIYVASGGKYVGTLTHNGTRFSGAISDPTVGEPLHFYFLGNVTPAETLTAGTTTTCSVIISDQTEHLPVIEYAPSNENYTAGASSFSAHLLNKCALVKFNVNTFSSAPTCIVGMKNKVIVDFSGNTITSCKEGDGVIKFSSGSGEKWAILLPQDAMDAGGEGSAYFEGGNHIGTRGAIPAIVENGYLTEGIEVNIPQLTVITSIPTEVGALSAKCGGSVISNDGSYILVKGFCWADHENPTTNDNCLEAGSGPGSFTSSMTNLIPNTVYYVRAFAVSVNGTTYGSEVSFTTMNGGVSVADLGLSYIGSYYAWNRGKVITGGLDIIECGVCWSTNSDFSECHCNHSYNFGFVPGIYEYEFEAELTSLTPHTIYYVRVYAITADGNTTYSSGNHSFITYDD